MMDKKPDTYTLEQMFSYLGELTFQETQLKKQTQALEEHLRKLEVEKQRVLISISGVLNSNHSEEGNSEESLKEE